jgi:hypothetical protein
MASPVTPAEPAMPAARAVRGSLALRAAVLVAAATCCGVGAWLGAWWIPFLAGVGGGLLGRTGPRPRRGLVLPAAAGAILGWLLVLWLLALDGQPVGATARTIAALAGLPPYAGVAVTVTLLLAALQVLVGAWLARAVIPRKAFAARAAPGRDKASGGGDPQAGSAADPQG